MWKAFKAQLARWLGLSSEVALPEWQASWSQFLSQHVAFYRHLSLDDQRLFEQRLYFLPLPHGQGLFLKGCKSLCISAIFC